jgi:hypothetical protein
MSNKLPSLLLDAVGAALKPFGFKLMKGKKRLVRRSENRTEVFGLPVVEYAPTYYVRPWVGVRFDEVENLFHQTSGFEPEYQQDTTTVGTSLWDVYGADGYDIPFKDEADVATVASQLLTIFREKALPYYEQFRTLTAVDAALNDQPNGPCIYRPGLPTARCSAGVIVAKLTGRKNYGELVSVYRSILKTDNNGFYLPAFESLLEKLEGISAGNCP